jgi:seryl-tRNA(Sec) selenium transferase
VADPTGNPLDRLEVAVSPSEAGTTAWMLAAELARGDPPIIVRDHEVANGHFFLDPCNLHPGEAEIVADRIVGTLRALQGQPIEDVSTLERRRFAALSQWPD